MLFGMTYRDTHVHLHVSCPLRPFSSTRLPITLRLSRRVLSSLCILCDDWYPCRLPYNYTLVPLHPFFFKDYAFLWLAICILLCAFCVLFSSLRFLSFRRLLYYVSTNPFPLFLWIVVNGFTVKKKAPSKFYFPPLVFRIEVQIVHTHFSLISVYVRLSLLT